MEVLLRWVPSVLHVSLPTGDHLSRDSPESFPEAPPASLKMDHGLALESALGSIAFLSTGVSRGADIPPPWTSVSFFARRTL